MTRTPEHRAGLPTRASRLRGARRVAGLAAGPVAGLVAGIGRAGLGWLRGLGVLMSVGVASVTAADCPGDLDNNGAVDGSDLGILLINWGSNGAGDIDGSGLVDGADVGILLIGWGACPPGEPQVSLYVGADSVTFSEGGSYGFASTIRVDGIGDTPLTVAIATTSSSGALTSVDDVPDGGFVADANGTVLFNTLLSSATSGGYTYTITATPDVGDPISISLPVTVVPINGIPSVAPMSAAPSAVNPGVANPVVFTLGLSGTTAPPANFTLYETDVAGNVVASVGTLRDDGADSDVVANDGVYSTTIVVTPGIDEQARYYRACEGEASCGEGLEGELLTLVVTNYPVGTSASNPESIVTLPDGREIYSDELLLVFIEGTTESRIAEIVASIDGTVVGSIPATGAYQVSIPGDSTGENVMNAIAAMKTVVDVDTADPIFPITPAEIVPNDPLWALQAGVAAIRAPETWTIATGSVAIAIVDTGVDATHPDLDGKVVALPDSDVLDGDDDPSDPDGHGTRMAGIAAAIGNNLYAVAGVSWQSPVIAVRAFGSGGSDVSLASGIVFAAANGARVINVSGTLREASPVIVSAVAFARERGCLIVASAGNTGGAAAEATYPCALDGVLCVGATDNGDRPLGETNGGAWVDLAAPGEDVPTITPGPDVAIVSGTSPAAAMVAGAAAVVWSAEPSLAAEAVAQRLLAGALELDGYTATLGAGRIDLFESTFDGSFELPGLGTWETDGTVSVLTSLGPLVPTDRERMVYISTGPAAANSEATLRKDFVIQPGVTEFGISFDYDFVTEEWPEFVGDQFNDSLRIVLVEPGGNEILLAVESINQSVFYPVEGINFPGGDQTVGHTGWKTVSAVIPVTKGPGTYTVRIEDAGDSLYDSVVLLDRIRLVGDPNALFCGAPAAGNCCEARETPFCVDAACCNAVCLYDPTCCQVAWDARCADVALALCNGLCGTPPVEICNNGLDDDYDTLTDCEDPDCEGEPNCGPGPGEICANGVDDDGDGLVDCDDPECAGFPQCEEGACGDPDSGDCCEANNTPHCTDASCCETVCAVDPFCCDNAWDDLCASQAVDLCNGLCEPPTPEDCRNGVDDDGDGLVDCDDPDCAGDASCPPATEDCTNGVDDDGDGLVDCDDPDCGKDPACGTALNDECEGAFLLTDGLNAVSNADATTGAAQPPASCEKNGDSTIHHDIWYFYTPTCSGIATISFCQQNGGTADFDTRLAVWRGGCDGLEIVACNDDACQQFRSRVEFDVVCGETYLVQLGGFAKGDVGSGELSVSCSGGVDCAEAVAEICDNGVDDDGDDLVDCDDGDCDKAPNCNESGTPVNDECGNALPVATGVVAFDTTNATTSALELPKGCASFGSVTIHNDIWFVWTATCDGAATISLCPSEGGAANFDTRLAVWSGECGDPQIVACNDDDCAQARSRVEFPVLCGETYLIQLGAYFADEVGSGDLSIECVGGGCGG